MTDEAIMDGGPQGFSAELDEMEWHSDEYVPGQEGDADPQSPVLPPSLLELETAEAVAALDSAERIERLFENMFSHQRTLLALMEACRETCSFEGVEQTLSGIQKGARSVFGADNYLGMLVDAGALEVVTAEGAPYVEVNTRPAEIERDGIVYLEVTEPPEAFWRLTDAGQQALAERDPLKKTKALILEKGVFRPAFTRMLELCSQGNGAGINELKEALNERPEMKEQKKTAQFLLDYLQMTGAVFYDADSKGWRPTETGRQVLQWLNESEG